MTTNEYNVMPTDKGLVKMWTKHVDVEESALEQLRNVADMPFIFDHVSAMPDVHTGMGATIGSVIPTLGAVMPAAVGVDIGCGMMAVRTDLDPLQLLGREADVRTAIERRIPHGRTHNGGSNDRGAWGKIPRRIWNVWDQHLACGFEEIASHDNRHVADIRNSNNANHLGTLGTGNHFIEICLDKDNRVWFMLHSGSRGVGAKIGNTFIKMAKQEMERYFIDLKDRNLAYFVEGTELFDAYIHCVSWAQDFAKMNRKMMLEGVEEAVGELLNEAIHFDFKVDCHHNFVTKEKHFGRNIWVTRKGAVRAREGDLCIIPGSMGARSYICEGLGERDSFTSCSHGAGRKMSRSKARKTFTVEDHKKMTKGIECRKDSDVIDETPGAYKDIDMVMKSQETLVRPIHELRQVICIKG
jgi:tRNA-splicing ligase RtcB